MHPRVLSRAVLSLPNIFCLPLPSRFCIVPMSSSYPLVSINQASLIGHNDMRLPTRMRRFLSSFVVVECVTWVLFLSRLLFPLRKYLWVDDC